MKTIFQLIIIALVFAGCTANNKADSQNRDGKKLLLVNDYQQKVYGYWMGQIIGNTYGLGYEFSFIDKPGPEKFPLGYANWTLERLQKCDGAFSDDDTDVEYMYLNLMEKQGVEPSYYNLAEAWKSAVKTKVWCANRAALTLMQAGFYPPLTGSKQFNVQWCQIDPQLTNEIWAVTAPGMGNYALAKTEFAARITSDSLGLEPTLHYAAMYSAAFFESDVNKLIDIGTAALPENSEFSKIVAHVKRLYAQYPNDWVKSRKIVKECYLDSCHRNNTVWNVIDANLNGAMGVMALLYGQGDFQKTLDYCCAFGMDCDNQAATMCGLLGVANGFNSIPRDLMFPLKDSKWIKPFNNYYKMVTREGLSDDSLTNTAHRIAIQGEKIILAHGGEIVQKDGQSYYSINTTSKFVAPFELNTLPELFIEINKPFSFPIYTGGISDNIKIEAIGKLPNGIVIRKGLLAGTPTSSGFYTFQIVAKDGLDKKHIEVKMTIHSKNLALQANEILYNGNNLDKNIEIIRDGLYNKTYFSKKKSPTQVVDYYGYRWTTKQTISAIIFNNGAPDEFGGWFTSFDIEYMKDDKWVKIENPNITPKMNLENTQWLKASFINYNISFAPIETNAIRIIGINGAIIRDGSKPNSVIENFSSISELSVFRD